VNVSRLVQLVPGSTFAGEFRVVRPIAEGGMGAIYEVTQIATGATRALKIMHPTLVSDEKLRQRFEQEAKVSVLIESDHVVQVLGAGVDKSTGIPWLAMELLKGETLASFLSHHGPLDATDAREVFSQLGHALAAAHDAGIVHRDLKPENIFLCIPRREGTPFTVKVLDFGIAKLVAEAHTHHTAAIGTPLWMAPEQTESGQTVKPATDVWALGLLAFHAFTGVHFWKIANKERLSAAALLREVVLDPLPTATERARELGVEEKLPPGFDEWFARCVVRPIDARFENARLAREALEALLPEAERRGSGRHPALIVQPTYPPDDVMRAMGTPLTTAQREAQTIGLEPTAPAPERPSRAETGEPTAQDVPVSSTPKAAIAIGLALLVAGGFVFLRMRGSNETASAAPSVSTAPKPSLNLSAAPPPALCPPGMANVAGGTFFVASKGDSVAIAPFCLDVAEATVSDWDACVKKGKCTTESVDVAPLCNWKDRPKKDRHPMNCIDWDQADAYCASSGKRLPTPEEWEWAAHGATAGTTFPWGEELASDQLCWSGVHKRVGLGTCEGRSHASGVTPFGVHDLAGNVSEWAAPDEKMHESVRPLVGDNWLTESVSFAKDSNGKPTVASRVAARKLHEATIGVRCAKAP
jgi:serine/threonine protein kinase/formylglycine-generating enzyme required for sulfatase activity